APGGEPGRCGRLGKTRREEEAIWGNVDLPDRSGLPARHGDIPWLLVNAPGRGAVSGLDFPHSVPPRRGEGPASVPRPAHTGPRLLTEPHPPPPNHPNQSEQRPP